MRHLFLLIIAFSFTQLNQAAFSQKVVKKISTDACHCMDKLNLKADAATLEEETQTCLVNAMLKNADAVSKELKFDFTNEEKMNELGVKLAMELMKSCDSFMKIMVIQNEKKQEATPKDSTND